MIRYREGYHYQMAAPYEDEFPELAGLAEIEHPYFRLSRSGRLYVHEGYAWDGLTGAIDDLRSLRPSLVHDITCQAVGEGLAPFELRTPHGDAVFRRLMLENGVPSIVAWWRWRAVTRYAQITGGGGPKPILEAP